MSLAMRVSVGTPFVKAAAIRKGSLTLGKWFGLELCAENKKQVRASAGYARGFCALSEIVELQH